MSAIKKNEYKSLPMKQISHADFFKEGDARFGESTKNWQFVCPRCGTVQSGQDFAEHGISEEKAKDAIGYSCIGRYTDKVGCDWTLGGLFQIHEIEVVDGDEVHKVFRLATVEEVLAKKA